jgi:hypothetical protein
VRRIVAQNGGEIVFGWTIWEWPNVYIEAEHHAVWRDTSGKLIDITPAQGGDVKRLFVPDPTAIYDFDKAGVQRFNKRKSFTKDENIKEYFRLADYAIRLKNSIAVIDDAEVLRDVESQLESIKKEIKKLILAIGMKHTPQNSLCFCGSGRKFKKCHRQ